MPQPEIGSGLRRRLVGLLACFGVFAVLAAAATILGTQWYVQRAVGDFEQQIGDTVRADRLTLLLRQHELLLRGLLEGNDGDLRSYVSTRDELDTTARQLLQSSLPMDPEAPEARAAELAARLVAESTRCMESLRQNDTAQAREIASGIERETSPALASSLVQLKQQSVQRLSQSSHRLATTSSQVLSLTLAIAAAAGALVVVGAWLIRRWLITPIGLLCQAAHEVGRGNFSHLAPAPVNNELGALGAALNEMASSVADAQGQLRSSESKHRALFRELRDAVVLVNADGLIVEYHDGETGLLGLDGSERIGQAVLDVWPSWRRARISWEANIRAAIGEGRRFKMIDVEFPRPGHDSPALVDVLIYRAAGGPLRQVAIVLRDVTERATLHRRLRHAETMEAVGTLASGLAHDLNNLLAGVTGNLSALEAQLPNEQHAARVQAAIRGCWQAAGLSRRLLNFAGSVHGVPEVFCLSEAVRTILDALDPSFLEGMELATRFEEHLLVRMDKDQFTQSLLNLLRNAREAMENGGSLRITTGRVTARHPDTQAMQEFAQLSVADSGTGMTAETQAKIFEPFFTTKSRDTQRGRGLGMAVVYAAVRNAGGHIRIVSSVGVGSEFQIYIPLGEVAGGTNATEDGPGRDRTLPSPQPPPSIAADSSGSFADSI